MLQFISKNKTYFLILFICSIFGFFLFTILFSFYLLKYLKYKIHENLISSKEFTDKQTSLLNQIGDNCIKDIYLVKSPLNKRNISALNLITLNNFAKFLQLHKNTFYHTSIIFQLKCGENNKFVKLDKLNYIRITDNFTMKTNYDIVKLPHKNKSLTINELLTQTKDRIGEFAFFNWNMFENNCQTFTREILLTAKLCTDDIVTQHEIVKQFKFSDFEWHLFCCLINIYNYISSFNKSVFEDVFVFFM